MSKKIDVERLKQLVIDATTAGPNPLPRVVVSVATKDDGIIFEQASGVRKLAATEEELKDGNQVAMDSIFWFASMTKLVTSLAAALLIEKGVWTLDSLAEDFVLEGYSESGEPILQDPKKRITIRHLLSHMAGTLFTMASPDLDRYRREHDLEVVWQGPKGTRETVAGLPLLWDPEERFSYAHNNDWLVFAVEGASGMDFEDYCQKHIFQPLGIDDMAWRRDARHIAKQVDLCFRKADNTGFTGAPLGVVERPEACSGGGGLFGSAVSYMKLIRTLLNDGISPDTGARLVKKDTIDMMITPLVTEERYLKQVWEYMKHDMPSSPAGDVELNTERKVCMIIKLITKDIEGGRRKGTFYNEGYANTYWFVDPQTGVCMVMLTDVAPWGDAGVMEFAAKFEKELYKQLLSSAA